MTRILVIDDDPVQLRLTSEVAARAGFTVTTASGGLEALSLISDGKPFDALVLDMVMPDLDGMAVLETLRERSITTPVIVQTASSSLETVVSAMRLGAVDFFVKPVAPERLTISLRNALRLGALETSVRLERGRARGTLAMHDIIASGPAMGRTLELAAKAAKSTIPVMIEGESGVGKELFARAIQGTGDRSSKPFIIVNCGAIPPNLVESTLFGHVKGAFTGAIADHAGKFVEAHGGTIFLDEIGELPLEAQVKLLRTIQDGTVEPVGGSKPVKVNVRIISATNRRLLNMAREGTFREDLYYRLNVFPIYVPPLRERIEDVGALCAHFVARFCAESGRRISGISPNAAQLLEAYDWPGNIRQLENAIFRAVVLCEGDLLQPQDFPQISAFVSGQSDTRQAAADLPLPTAPVHIDDAPAQISTHLRTPADSAPATNESAAYRFMDADGTVQTLSDVERDLILFAIAHHAGHMSQVARSLGIGRSTLYRKLKEYGIEPAQNAQAA